MSQWSYYTDDPQWMSAYRYAMHAPNGGYYLKQTVGNPGMQSPMFIHSDEYSQIYLKRGYDGPQIYNSSLKPFSKNVTAKVQCEVENCTNETLNPYGCQYTAIQDIRSASGAHVHPYGLCPNRGAMPGSGFHKE